MTDLKKTASNILPPRNIVESAQQYILKRFNEKAGNQLLFNNYQRTTQLVELVQVIGENMDSETLEIATLAAWFQSIGCVDDYKNYENKSVVQARVFLQNHRYPESKTNRVLHAILNARKDGVPMGQAEGILSDAVTAFDYTIDFFGKNPLKRLERELVLNEKIETAEWEQLQLNHLLEAKFYTSFGKIKYEPTLAQNIFTQKKIAEKGRAKAFQKAEDDEENKLRKYQNIEKKVPRSGIQTFFRSNYRAHTHLSMIADRKANILISVNSIVISMLISVLTYQDVTTTSPQILLPVVTFLMTGMTSLVFAILAIRPKVTQLNTSKTSKDEVKKNIVFFGNFVHLELEEYEEAMDAVFRDSELMYGNMTRDLYHLGKVLDKKYRYLTNAYNIFMVGFVATVLIFLVSIFL